MGVRTKALNDAPWGQSMELVVKDGGSTEPGDSGRSITQLPLMEFPP